MRAAAGRERERERERYRDRDTRKEMHQAGGPADGVLRLKGPQLFGAGGEERRGQGGHLRPEATRKHLGFEVKTGLDT